MVTSRTYPEENLIKSTDLKYPITIDLSTLSSEDAGKVTAMPS